MLRVELVTPAVPVMQIAEAKAHLRIDHDDEDRLIQTLIDTAVGYLDGMNGVLGRALGQQVWRAVFKEGDEDQTLPLVPVISQEDPVTADGETTIEFTAGYPTGIPAPLRTAILLHIGSLYHNREQSAADWKPTLAYEALLAPYRRWV